MSEERRLTMSDQLPNEVMPSSEFRAIFEESHNYLVFGRNAISEVEGEAPHTRLDVVYRTKPAPYQVGQALVLTVKPLTDDEYWKLKGWESGADVVFRVKHDTSTVILCNFGPQPLEFVSLGFVSAAHWNPPL
jgi:hypothetical protein